MPVDLSAGGSPRPYPAHGPRFWPWLGIWAVCNIVGASLVILLWPAGRSTHGAEFWSYVCCIPNLVFTVLLGFDRAAYEAQWIRAHYRNVHRRKWLDGRVRDAQQPLQVMGAGYCLPTGGQTLAAVMTARKTLPKGQPPREGTMMIVHNRFEDAALSDAPQTETPEQRGGARPESVEPPRQIATIILKIAEALQSIAPGLRALSQYESHHWPQVRVLAAPARAALREAQVRDALRIAGLPALSCLAVPEADGLLVADAWLDARERRPLLIIAAHWHDSSPPVGSAEGCVAVLLGSGSYTPPEPVKILGLLHRPVAGEATAFGDLFTNVLTWGKTAGEKVAHAWMTGFDHTGDAALLAGLRAASMASVARHDAQSRPDRIVGDAGAANGWLSVVAAIESGATGPQLIVDHLQAAILYVHSHDNTNE